MRKKWAIQQGWKKKKNENAKYSSFGWRDFTCQYNGPCLIPPFCVVYSCSFRSHISYIHLLAPPLYIADVKIVLFFYFLSIISNSTYTPIIPLTFHFLLLNKSYYIFSLLLLLTDVFIFLPLLPCHLHPHEKFSYTYTKYVSCY